MGFKKKEETDKSKQKGHIKDAGCGWADIRWKLDVEAIVKGLCKERVALGVGNLGLMGTIQRFQVMS